MFVDHSRPSPEDAELRLDYLDPVTLARGHVVIDGLAQPAYGAVRAHTELKLGQLMTLARQRTLRYQLARVPLVGAQLGLCYDPKAPDFAEVLGRFFAALRPYLDTSLSLGPDANVSPGMLDQVLAQGRFPNRMSIIQARQGWDEDAYNRYQRVVGVAVGGERLKDIQSAFSVAVATKTIGTQQFGRSITAAVLGNGRYSTQIARHLDAHGVRVMAVGDSSAAVYAPQGLPRKLLESGDLLDISISEVRYITGEELLGLDVDVLVAASNEDVIGIHNVGRLRCGLVVESATHAISAEGEVVLVARGIPVYPSFAATIGPVFLTDGALRGTVRTADEALRYITEHVTTTSVELMRLHSSLNITFREAGLRTAFHYRVDKHPLRRVSARMRVVSAEGL